MHKLGGRSVSRYTVRTIGHCISILFTCIIPYFFLTSSRFYFYVFFLFKRINHRIIMQGRWVKQWTYTRRVGSSDLDVVANGPRQHKFLYNRKIQQSRSIVSLPVQWQRVFSSNNIFLIFTCWSPENTRRTNFHFPMQSKYVLAPPLHHLLHTTTGNMKLCARNICTFTGATVPSSLLLRPAVAGGDYGTPTTSPYPYKIKAAPFSSSCYMRAAAHHHMCMLHISSRPQSISFSFLLRPSNRFKRIHSLYGSIPCGMSTP